MEPNKRRANARDKAVKAHQHLHFTSGLAFIAEANIKSFLMQARSTGQLNEDTTAQLYHAIELLDSFQKAITAIELDE